jgi:hypothetical protein
MTSLTTFDSTKGSLQDILQNIKTGKTQLPDFQRGWVWDDEHVRSLLASISVSYPIGAVMMLQTGNSEVKFKPRLVEGVELDKHSEPESLILDGQQRLTSLYQSLFSGKPVVTKDYRRNNIRRWYYIDINKVLNPHLDREESILSIPEDRMIRNFRGEVIADYSTIDKECEAEVFPLPLVFDTSAFTDWMSVYLSAKPELTHERMARWKYLVQNIIQRFQQYQVPLIILLKETPKEAVCQVFEKVNTGGVSLTVFELLTATFAAENFNLREDWSTREHRLQQYKLLEDIKNDELLQVITLLVSRDRRVRAINEGVDLDKAPGITCKRKDILRLTLDEYQSWADQATKGFERAARFLQGQNIFASRDLPYKTQLVPLAAILAVLGDKSENDSIRLKLARWYWCGVFGELYGGAIETRFAKDLPEVLSWLDGGAEPDTISDANFATTRLLTLRTRNSAAYKGIYTLLLRDGGLDFRTGEPTNLQMYFDDNIDIHHIFPQAWCKSQGIDPKYFDSVINKTPLSAKTNRIVGGNAPSIYLTRLEKTNDIKPERMDEILQSHVINPSTLREDKFEEFFKERQQALLYRIGQAMGKPINGLSNSAECEAIAADNIDSWSNGFYYSEMTNSSLTLN